MRFTVGNDLDAITRFYIGYTGTAPTNSDLNEFCEDVSNDFTTDLKALMHPDNQLVEVTAEDLTNNTSAVGFWSGTIAGSRSGHTLPGGACVVASYKIPRRYRGGHPRGYWPLLSAEDLDGPNVWGASVIAGTQTDLNQFFTDVVAEGWTGAGTLSHLNVSYFQGFTNVTFPSGRIRPVPTRRGTPVTDTVSTVAVNPHVGSQRRRNQQGV